ncbi:MAG: DegQ family serine endoprotease [Methanothrix sp.]|nr:DegQ family serine endoprotease [Methanothrix sp.]
MHNRIRISRIPVFLVVLGVLFLVSGAYAAIENTIPVRNKTISPESNKLLGSLSNALAEVAEAVRPAVVNISTTTTVPAEANPFGDMFNDPFFRRFFGDQFSPPGFNQKRKTSSLGSGVIVSDKGYILTNNHVVKGADDIKVVLYDKREFNGKIVGADPKTDLAVVKIDAKDLPTVTMGSSAALKTGDVVLAIGNPFGLNQTITMGIVSAVGRSNLGLADFVDFIQTDAAINPGNSGGALVNTNGELIGINTAIFSTSGGYMGIGFAIPSDMATSIMDSIIKTGKVIRGWLGVSIQDLSPDLAKSFNTKDQAGALVSGVMEGSPADKAGLKRGDLIIELDGKAIADSISIRNRVSALAPGTKIEIKIVRNGNQQSLTATLGELKEKADVKKMDYSNVLKGVTVQDLTTSLRDKLDIPENVTGVVVTDVAPDSRNQRLLQVNDLIQEVNRQNIKSVQDYDKVVSKIGEKDGVLLLIYRQGGSVYITIKP